MTNWNNIPDVDVPHRNPPADIPQPDTGVGNPGSVPFGPGAVQDANDDDGQWLKDGE